MPCITNPYQHSTLSDSPQANTMGWRITLGLDNLNSLLPDKPFRNEVADELHSPLLASLVGGLNGLDISSGSIVHTRALTSLTGAMKFSLIRGGCTSLAAISILPFGVVSTNSFMVEESQSAILAESTWPSANSEFSL